MLISLAAVPKTGGGKYANLCRILMLCIPRVNYHKMLSPHPFQECVLRPPRLQQFPSNLCVTREMLNSLSGLSDVRGKVLGVRQPLSERAYKFQADHQVRVSVLSWGVSCRKGWKWALPCSLFPKLRIWANSIYLWRTKLFFSS